MFEKEKVDENLIKLKEEIKRPKLFLKKSSTINEDIFTSNKDNMKTGEDLSDTNSNRLSLKNEGDNNPLLNSETNSFENSYSNLQSFHKVKFRLTSNINNSDVEEDDDKKSQSGINNSTIGNNFFRTQNIMYLCNLLSHSVGFESIWRFPYYFITAEGAVFFIPFLIFYFFLGIPLLTIESALGQIFKKSPISISSIVKDSIYINNNYSTKSIKFITLFIAYIITLYFSSLISQCIHFFLLSFEYNLPWSYQLNTDKLYHSPFFKTKFINHDSTHQNFDAFRLGEIDYHKLFSSFLTWFIFYILMISNIKIKRHKFLYSILCLFPIGILIILIIVCIHPSKGFKKGCIYFLIPNMEKLLHYRVWICGINQAIFLLMLGYGKNFLFSSTIKEKDNVYTRSTITSLLVLFLGIFWTFYNCIYAGLIAEELNIESINNIPFNNSNIPFLTNLLSIGMMKHSRIFSFLFLISLIIIGFQTQFLLVKNFSNFLKESFPNYLNEKIAPLILCVISFILCIPFTRYQGQFFLEWIDRYITLIPLIFVIFFEIMFIMRKLGINLLLEIISNKTNIILPLYIFYFTKYISPVVLVIMMLLGFIYQFNHGQHSTLTKSIEWTLLLAPFIIFIFFFIKDYFNKERESDVTKDEENILIDEIDEIPKRRKERRKTGIIKGQIKIPDQQNLPERNSSFSNLHRSEKLLFTDEFENNSLLQNNDIMSNNDNINSVTENNTRKPTIEMEVINKK